MRIFMLLLILANLGFFAWMHWVAPADDGLPAGRVNESLGVGLQLAREREATGSEPVAVTTDVPASGAAGRPEETGDVVNSPGQAEPPEEGGSGSETASAQQEAALAEPAYRCVSLGPFGQLELAEVARERLRERGYGARLREAGGQIRSGFWVYLPPHESRGDAKEIEAQLREKGVRDLFIVTGAENRNAISLGLFSTPDRADQRAAEIGRLGFNPQIAERFRDATVYWLDYREQGDDRLEPQSLGVLGVDEVIPEKRNRDCSAADFAMDGTS